MSTNFKSPKKDSQRASELFFKLLSIAFRSTWWPSEFHSSSKRVIASEYLFNSFRTETEWSLCLHSLHVPVLKSSVEIIQRWKRKSPDKPCFTDETLFSSIIPAQYKQIVGKQSQVSYLLIVMGKPHPWTDSNSRSVILSACWRNRLFCSLHPAVAVNRRGDCIWKEAK